MTDEDLAALDARAARSRRALASTTGAVEVPPWQPRRRDRWLLAVAVVVSIVLVGVVGVVTSGDRDIDSVEVAAGSGRYFAPTETLGLPVLRAVSGDEIPRPRSPLVVVYGDDPELRGAGVIVGSDRVDFPFEVVPGEGGEEVQVDGLPGLLTRAPGMDLVNLTWQPEEDLLVYITVRGFDPESVLALAADVVTDADGGAALEDPVPFGLEELTRGRADEVLPGPAGGGPQRNGSLLRYGREDGVGPQISVLAGPGDERVVDALRLVLPGAEDAEISGAEALIAPLRADGEDVMGWVVSWQPDDATVVSIIGVGLSRAEVSAVAESVRPIDASAFRALAESDDYDPADELPGLEPARTVIVRGTLADGDRWRLDAPEPESGAPIAVRFTWTSDGSSTGSEVQASSDGAPVVLATRATNVQPEHVYGFSSALVERLRWEAPDGGGGGLPLRDIGDPRGRYFVEPLPADVGTITLIAEDGDGVELGRFEMPPEATVESGMATTSTTAG